MSGIRPIGESVAVQVESEISDYLDSNRRFRQLLPRAALVGLLAGIMAVAFRIVLVEADHTQAWVLAWASQFPTWGWLIMVMFGATGAVAAVWLTLTFAPEVAGSGIPHLKGVLHRLRELQWHRVLVFKFVGGMLALGSGLVLGREGPTVQMGGAVGDAVSRLFKSGMRERLTLTAAGAGAGLAAAFNAPLSGLIFVLEEVRRDFQPAMFGAAFVAAAVADIVARLVSGQFPVFSVPSYPAPSLSMLPLFVVLGVICGLAGVVYNRTLMRTSGWMSQVSVQGKLAFAATVGAIIGGSAWLAPMVVGNGHALAENVLTGQLLLTAIPLMLGLRFVFAMASYATGAPGGIFAPLLVLGALIGLGLGLLAQQWLPDVVLQPGIFAVVGMAALFTGIVRAPLTGVVLILEMTGNYNQMLPLLMSCFCAYVTAEALRDMPIYEALLARDIERNGVTTLPAQPVVAEYVIEDGSDYAGRTVRDLGWPQGCILVRCVIDSHEIVPTADTVLQSQMRITVVVPPHATPALAMIREGCDVAD